MGREVGASLASQNGEGLAERVNAVTETMLELGYDATAHFAEGSATIEAQNCVFHQLAIKNPAICRFDLAMLETATGMIVDHKSCMARGEAKCCFALTKRKA